MWCQCGVSVDIMSPVRGSVTMTSIDVTPCSTRRNAPSPARPTTDRQRNETRNPLIILDFNDESPVLASLRTGLPCNSQSSSYLAQPAVVACLPTKPT